MLTLFKKQRGAMFGLDARIALSIFAGLSVITGASMIQIMKDNKSDEIAIRYSQISEALDLMQSDLETNIGDALTTPSAINVLMALEDETLLTAAYRPKWRGPYIKGAGTNYDKTIGTTLRIVGIQTASGATGCTGIQLANAECSYALGYTSVPMQHINKLNERFDGTAEATPSTEGMVRWTNVSGGNATLLMVMGKMFRS